MNKELEEISRVMRQAHSRDISPYDESFLLKSVDKRLAATEIKTAAAYSEYLSENSPEAEAFFRSLRIPYSEFFRNPLTFALLEQLVLPSLIAEKEKAGRAEIRIWRRREK
jgi:chemotaxis protein methyltransferase CheR